MKLDIRDLDKAEVLLALYNNAKLALNSQMIGMTLFFLNRSLDLDSAQALLNKDPDIRFIGNVGICIDFSNSYIDVERYDKRYCNESVYTAEAVINELRFTMMSGLNFD